MFLVQTTATLVQLNNDLPRGTKYLSAEFHGCPFLLWKKRTLGCLFFCLSHSCMRTHPSARIFLRPFLFSSGGRSKTRARSREHCYFKIVLAAVKKNDEPERKRRVYERERARTHYPGRWSPNFAAISLRPRGKRERESWGSFGWWHNSEHGFLLLIFLTKWKTRAKRISRKPKGEEQELLWPLSTKYYAIL